MSPKVNHFAALLLVAMVAAFSVGEARAQESELKVVDEVVAVAGDGVLTLSRVKREMENAISSLIDQGKSREEATALVKAKEGDLIASLINEELLLQKGKEAGVEADADAQVNQRFLEFMKQQNLKTIDALYKEMEKQGIDPQEIRESWRKQAIKDLVISREVDAKTYWSWSPKEIKAYYEKNKARFMKPEVVTLSEIFLSFAGRDENAVREKAKQVAARLQGGADFGLVATEVSDRPDAKDSKGDLGPIPMPQLKEVNEKLAAPVAATKVGDITGLIETAEGIEIFKVTAREEASKESVFDEGEVRKAMTVDVTGDRRKAFMIKLREDNYIKIADSYRPMVAPVLFADERKAEAAKPTK